MKEIFYFTFGQDHFHPETCVLLSDYWIRTIGFSFIEARKLMFGLFESKWSFQYNENDFESQYFPKGCYETYIKE